MVRQRVSYSMVRQRVSYSMVRQRVKGIHGELHWECHAGSASL